MNKKKNSKFSLYFAFSFWIFNLMWLNMGISYILFVFLFRLGIFNNTKNLLPAVLTFLIVISSGVGFASANIGGRLILKPITRLINAMKELANGNFDVRIRKKGIFIPIELSDCYDGFNETAKELGSVEMLRSDFVNNFSHEFKSPIVSLRGFAKLLKEDDLTPEKRQEYLDIIISESERLSELATNVLNLAKIENQAILTEYSPFNISEQIRRSILMLESKWSQKNLQFEINIEDDVIFNGNEELLSQIWVNLLDNAIKFSGKGGDVEIELTNTCDNIVFEIRDYGCGMDNETKTHIFNKFYQGDKSHTSEGNGLGMAIVEKIAALHNGKVYVDSKQDNGTLIRIELPKIDEN